MERNENEFWSANNNDSGLNINPEIKHYLRETAGWGKFLGILGFVFIGLMLLGLFGFSIFFSNSFQNGAYPYGAGPNMGILMGIYFLFFAALYFFPSWYIYQFATKTKTALLYNQETDLIRAFSRLKSFFKFWGILTIIFMAFYGLALLAMGFGMFMAR